MNPGSTAMIQRQNANLRIGRHLKSQESAPGPSKIKAMFTVLFDQESTGLFAMNTLEDVRQWIKNTTCKLWTIKQHSEKETARFVEMRVLDAPPRQCARPFIASYPAILGKTWHRTVSTDSVQSRPDSVWLMVVSQIKLNWKIHWKENIWEGRIHQTQGDDASFCYSESRLQEVFLKVVGPLDEDCGFRSKLLWRGHRQYWPRVTLFSVVTHGRILSGQTVSR